MQFVHPDECLEMAKADFTVMVSLLDARYLDGDDGAFTELQNALLGWMGSKPRKKLFLANLKAAVAERHGKYGQTPYLLQPNVKEGQGGLRDIQTIVWGGIALYHLGEFDALAVRGLLPEDRVDDLKSDYEYMWKVRTYLQYLAGEKTDTLTFNLQEGVAEHLGYLGNGQIAVVEHFMQDYYTRVYRTKSTLDYFLSRVEEDLRPAKVWQMTQKYRSVEKGLFIRRGQVEFSGPAEVRQRPILMMRALEAAVSEGIRLSQKSLEIVRTNLDLVDEKYREDPEVARVFLRTLVSVPTNTANAPRNFEAMQSINFLAAYIPEMAGIQARVQHDAYHVFTVDVHLVLTLWELRKLAAGVDSKDDDELERSVLSKVEDREVLFLAAFLHDIGKGQGPDHAARGAEMVPEIGRRLGLSDDRVDTLAFLVAEHLFLIEIATRRDLSEEKLILNCANRIGDIERLNMLFLLTVADSRATGPGGWNQWKGGLLRELYFKIHHVLTAGGSLEKEVAKRTGELQKQVTILLKEHLSDDDVAKHFTIMSAHYLSVMDAEQIARHILLERQLNDQPLIWEVDAKDESYSDVVVITPDRPGLLSRMAGVFTLHNVNIMGAQVFTRDNGIALDVFQVANPPDALFADETWKKVKRDTVRALTGHLALDYRLAKKTPVLQTGLDAPRRPSKVVVDNETSDFHTIVEVFTHDRLGLLYQLTKTLFDLQLSIYVAKISTKVDQVVDVFYVRDFFGQKLTDEGQIKELKAALKFTIEQ